MSYRTECSSRCFPARGLLVAALLGVGVLAGCSERADFSTATEEAAGVAPPLAQRAVPGAPAPSDAGPSTQNLPTRADQVATEPGSAPTMLIRRGDATVEVDSLDAAVGRARQIAEQVGGFVANASMQLGHDQRRQATLELRIPADRWDRAVGALPGLGRVRHVNVQAEDVGEQYIDVSARLANLRQFEQRLLQILTARTGSLEDVLAVERELARVRGEIEQLQGRLRFLETRVATSTLMLTLQEPPPLLGEYRGASIIGEAFRQAWRNLVHFTAAFIAALGILVPLGIILVAVALAARWLWRGRRAAAAP